MLEIDEFLSKRRRVIKSSLDAVNKLFNGEPYTNDIMFAYYGLPQSGKTLLMLQEAVWFESLGHRVLFVDTEGSLVGFAREWLPKLRRRFNGDYKPKGKLFVVEKRTLYTFMQFLGKEVKITVKKPSSPKGTPKDSLVTDKSVRVEFNYVADVKSEIDEEITRRKVDVLIIDSLTAPLRSVIPSSQQNFPARSDAISLMLGQLLLLQEKHDLVIITTNHATLNPADKSDRAKMRGGTSIYYYIKHIAYVDKRAKKGVEDYRRFWLVRSPTKPEWSDVGVAKITDEGYVDVGVRSEKDLETYLTEKEMEWIMARKGSFE